MDINMNGQDINGGFWEKMKEIIENKPDLPDMSTDQTIYSPMMVDGIRQINREAEKARKKMAEQYEADE